MEKHIDYCEFKKWLTSVKESNDDARDRLFNLCFNNGYDWITGEYEFYNGRSSALSLIMEMLEHFVKGGE